MVNYQEQRVKLTNTQLNKLKSAEKFSQYQEARVILTNTKLNKLTSVVKKRQK